MAELMKGKRFTPETAFHMETTLGLPHGFFDQPNPALADETIARLKSPLDFVQIDEGFDAGYEALARASASGFDIADRPNGKKRMDSVEASRFTERLGLPVGWLDNPRTEGEIPESVSDMLAPAPRGRASVQQHEPPALATVDGAKADRSGGKTRTRRERATALHDSDSPSIVSSDVAEDKASIVVSPQPNVDIFPSGNDT
nr:hypothetical protein [Paraburkholderia caribensis]